MTGEITLRIVLTGQEALEARLRNAPANLIQILRTAMGPLANTIREDAAERAGHKTGQLAAGIRTTVGSNPREVYIVAYTQGVPYALAQEHGATYAPRVISAVKANVLAFAGGYGGSKSGDMSFFRSVNWPGATIPAKHYILRSLTARRADFKQICEQAMQQTLQQVVER